MMIYLFLALVLISGLGVILLIKVIQSVLYLILVFFLCSLLFIYLGADFMNIDKLKYNIIKIKVKINSLLLYNFYYIFVMNKLKLKKLVVFCINCLKVLKKIIFIWYIIFYNIDLNSLMTYMMDDNQKEEEETEDEKWKKNLIKYLDYIYVIGMGIFLIYWLKTNWPTTPTGPTSIPTDFPNDFESSSTSSQEEFISMLDDLEKGYDNFHKRNQNN